MQADIDHAALDAALRRLGSSWDASQAHGLLSGRLAVRGGDGGFEWLSQVLDGTDPASVHDAEEMLRQLHAATYRQLAERQSEFEPLLPADDDSAPARAAGLAHWCEGFLHGLVSTDNSDAVRERLGAEPLADIIRDMLQLTRAGADDDDDPEGRDAAWAELVEYLRVAAQLAYEELADLRPPAGSAGENQPLH